MAVQLVEAVVEVPELGRPPAVLPLAENPDVLGALPKAVAEAEVALLRDALLGERLLGEAVPGVDGVDGFEAVALLRDIDDVAGVDDAVVLVKVLPAFVLAHILHQALLADSVEDLEVEVALTEGAQLEPLVVIVPVVGRNGVQQLEKQLDVNPVRSVALGENR